MRKITADDPQAKSPDLAAENLARLRALFPEAVTEGADGPVVNVDVLKTLIGDRTVSDAEEKYGLTWHGKRRARQGALSPSTGTLRPCPEDSVDWDTTQNLMIEGDNLEVLKLLQKSYAGKVKLIYIDPPYNTGKDFVYPDNFQDTIRNYLELTGQVEGGTKISSNTEASGRFHTDWLNMMYPRLKLARNLLKEDGVLFVSIDEIELSNLLLLLNDVFGEENMLPPIIRRAKIGGGSDNKHIAKEADYILGVAKSTSCLGKFFSPHSEKDLKRYSHQDERGAFFWDTYSRAGLVSDDPETDSLYYTVEFPDGQKRTDRWRRSSDRLQRDLLDGEAKFIMTENGWNIHFKQRLNMEGKRPRQILYDRMGNIEGGSEIESLCPEMRFQYPKPTSLVRFVAEICDSYNDLVLDFFAGSGTTGHAIISQNISDGGRRRYILVQLPEPLDPENKDQKIAAEFCRKQNRPLTIAELTKERLRRAGQKIREENPLFSGDLGFRVFKLDTSNLRAWDPDRGDLEGTLAAAVEHVKEGRTEADLLFELLLKLGLELTVPMTRREIAGKTVHSIGAGTLLACLAESISAAEAELLGLGLVAWHQELAPAGETSVVFRDSAFADDVAKTNLAAILAQHGLENVRSL